jgi:hypothetical protein
MSFVASHISAQTRFLVDAAASRRAVMTTIPHDGTNGLDVAAWSITHTDGYVETLVLAVQMNYIPSDSTVEFGLLGIPRRVKEVLFGGVEEDDSHVRFKMGRISVAGVIVENKGSKETVLNTVNNVLRIPIPLGTGR